MGEGRAGALELRGSRAGDSRLLKGRAFGNQNPDGLCTVPKSTDLPQTIQRLSTSSQTASSIQATIFRGSQGLKDLLPKTLRR